MKWTKVPRRPQLEECVPARASQDKGWLIGKSLEEHCKSDEQSRKAAPREQQGKDDKVEVIKSKDIGEV